jgi:hypothetical protein
MVSRNPLHTVENNVGFQKTSGQWHSKILSGLSKNLARVSIRTLYWKIYSMSLPLPRIASRHCPLSLREGQLRLRVPVE